MSTSIQYRALREILETKDPDIKDRLYQNICYMADHVLTMHGKGKLSCGCPNLSGEISMNDELWDIFMDEEFANYYDLLLQHEGNADDECQLLANYWIMTLAGSGAHRYYPIIKHLAEVNCFGL